MKSTKLDKADEINLTIGFIILVVTVFISLAHYLKAGN